MFVPNRFLTVKEQILLLSTMAVVLLGIGTLYFYKGQEEPAVPEDIAGGYRRIVPGNALPIQSPRKSSPPEVSAPVEPLPMPPPPRPKEVEGEVTPVQEEAESWASFPEFLATPRQIGVAVMGAVKDPGFYHLDDGSRLSDLLIEAGMALDTADLSELLMTAQLMDGTTLTVPYQSYLESDAEGLALRRPETDYRLNPDAYLRRPPRRSRAVVAGRTETAGAGSTGKATSGSTTSPDGRISLNTADARELQQLPGIGPTLSAAIVAEREKGAFSSADDLLRVPGIGPKRLDAIRGLISVP